VDACRADADPVQVLSGTALRVYLYMLRRRVVGVREVQRALGLKSPSTAKHHLDRLVSLGLAVKTSEGYAACRPRTGLLSLYIVASGRLIPRLIGVAAALTVLSLATIPYSPLLGCAEAAVTLLLWLDSARLVRAVKKLEEAC